MPGSNNLHYSHSICSLSICIHLFARDFGLSLSIWIILSSVFQVYVPCSPSSPATASLPGKPGARTSAGERWACSIPRWKGPPRGKEKNPHTTKHRYSSTPGARTCTGLAAPNAFPQEPPFWLPPLGLLRARGHHRNNRGTRFRSESGVILT